MPLGGLTHLSKIVERMTHKTPLDKLESVLLSGFQGAWETTIALVALGEPRPRDIIEECYRSVDVIFTKAEEDNPELSELVTNHAHCLVDPLFLAKHKVIRLQSKEYSATQDFKKLEIRSLLDKLLNDVISLDNRVRELRREWGKEILVDKWQEFSSETQPIQ